MKGLRQLFSLRTVSSSFFCLSYSDSGVIFKIDQLGFVSSIAALQVGQTLSFSFETHSKHNVCEHLNNVSGWCKEWSKFSKFIINYFYIPKKNQFLSYNINLPKQISHAIFKIWEKNRMI